MTHEEFVREFDETLAVAKPNRRRYVAIGAVAIFLLGGFLIYHGLRVGAIGGTDARTIIELWLGGVSAGRSYGGHALMAVRSLDHALFLTVAGLIGLAVFAGSERHHGRWRALRERL